MWSHQWTWKTKGEHNSDPPWEAAVSRNLPWKVPQLQNPPPMSLSKKNFWVKFQLQRRPWEITAFGLFFFFSCRVTANSFFKEKSSILTRKFSVLRQIMAHFGKICQYQIQEQWLLGRKRRRNVGGDFKLDFNCFLTSPNWIWNSWEVSDRGNSFLRWIAVTFSPLHCPFLRKLVNTNILEPILFSVGT